MGRVSRSPTIRDVLLSSPRTMRSLQLAAAFAVLALAMASAAPSAPPQTIIYFLVDDLGFANVGYNNKPNAEPLTPTIDALHDSGAELTNYYAYKFCSPTRSSFLSGRLPIHVNQQNHPPTSPAGGVPKNMTTIADKLQAAGYYTAMMGKWHCGMSCPELLPINRGYNSSLGYLSGAEDHYANTRTCGGLDGIDFWRSSLPAYGEDGNKSFGGYATYKYTAEALRVIDGTEKEQKLFMYVAFGNVHGPLQAPENYTALYNSSSAKKTITYRPRLMCLAMISAVIMLVDDAISRIVARLKSAGRWENTLAIFSSDNGGPADHANNWPLRGSKGTDFEGGTRVCAFLNGGALSPALRGKQVLGMMHVTDWWATLSLLVGQDTSDAKAKAHNLPNVDSLDMRAMLMLPGFSGSANATSPRAKLVLSGLPFTPGTYPHAAMIKTMALPGQSGVHRMKLVLGSQGGYYGGQFAPNETAAVQLAHCTVAGAGSYGGKPGCLFNLDLDPTEHADLGDVAAYKPLLAALTAELLQEISSSYFQSAGSQTPDHQANVVARNRSDFWGPWLPNGQWIPPPLPPGPGPPGPVPPKMGFAIVRSSLAVGVAEGGAAPAKCLTVMGLDKSSLAVYGKCDGGSHWNHGGPDASVAAAGGGSSGSSTSSGPINAASCALYNVAAVERSGGYLRESPGKNCSVGNTVQLGIAGGHGGITTSLTEGGLLQENACDGLCVRLGPGCGAEPCDQKLVLTECTDKAAGGWAKATHGHLADPYEMWS